VEGNVESLKQENVRAKGPYLLEIFKKLWLKTEL
jgi:hypothetical protein